ncbi:MAG: aminopeptidase P N-terminal domain-containing protein [Candidatus Brocadiae bacterium]|nr:aminopeptidase P N-terminal domain-containing protein [Candidatus Brocadiia bacterium]
MRHLLARALLAFAVFAALPVAAQPAPAPSKDSWAARRDRLREQIGGGIGLVPAAEAAPKGVAFRQDNDFWYLTGLDWPGAVLALTAEGAWLFTAEADRTAPEGFVGVLPLSSLDVAIGRYAADGLWLHAGQEEYYSTPIVPGEIREFGDPFARSTARAKWADGIAARFKEGRRKSLHHRVARLRLVKDEGEIAILRRGVEVTGKSLMDAIGGVKPGMKEREFQRALEQGYVDRGAGWLAFPTIVGSGANGTMVHYTANSGALGRNELVVVDTGAEVEMYACDVTRTFPVTGAFTKRQREVYQAVLDAQRAAIRAAKPGVTMMDLDRIAKDVLADRGFRDRMPHWTCHWVGLGVHDAGEYLTRLEPGMVITVEPGVYIPEEAIGVRIEDLLLITEGEPEILSEFVPVEAEEIEKLVGSRRK